MTISLNSDLPWLEDTLYVYYMNSVKNTFPSFDFATIFIAIFHIVGFYVIYLGFLLPPKYLWIHTVYIFIILISYYIFDNNCFMTLFANMDTSEHKTPIYVRMETAMNFLLFLLGLNVIGILFPNLSAFRIIKYIILKLEP